jgi:hypothetical protein
LEFNISPSEDYLDLSSTRIRLKFEIVSSTNEKLTANSTVAPVNNFLHSVFNNVSVELNQKCITPQSSNYQYRAYVDHLLNYGKDVQDTRLQSSMFYKDVGDMLASAGNTGYVERCKISKNVFELESHVHSDIFNTDRYLLSNVQLNIKFYRGKPEFSLIAGENENGKFQIKIRDAVLIIRKVRISPTVALAHAATLQKFNARYPIIRTECKAITLSKNIQNHTIDNIILGQLPKRIIVFFVTSESYVGSLKTNPFKIEHFNHTFLNLHTDTSMIFTPFKPNFAEKQYMSSYNSLFFETGRAFSETSCNISYEDYLNNCFTVFDLTPDGTANESHLSSPHSGNLRLEVNFDKPLDKPITCLLYCEFQNLIEISSDRQVFTDYTA